MAAERRRVTGVQTGEGVFIYHEGKEFTFCDRDGNQAHFKDIDQVRNALQILISNA